MNTEILIIGGFVLLVIVVLIANARRETSASQEEEALPQGIEVTRAEKEMLRLQLRQVHAAEQAAGHVGCIMWLLLGLVFGPIILIILAFLLGLLPLLLALFGAS